MLIFRTSPGPSRSVGRGGIVDSVEEGIEGAGGSAAAFSTSIKTKGSCPGLEGAAACRISNPVGPLDGRPAQPANDAADATMKLALRNNPLRRGTRLIDIKVKTLETVR